MNAITNEEADALMPIGVDAVNPLNIAEREPAPAAPDKEVQIREQNFEIETLACRVRKLLQVMIHEIDGHEPEDALNSVDSLIYCALQNIDLLLERQHEVMALR